jgi:uncharacterized membrane protein YbhN (UPF0104 family)
MAPVADFSAVTRTFFNAAGKFFEHLADVRVLPLLAALVFLAAMQIARARAWRNVLVAAYPGEPLPFRPLAAAFLVGAGVNAVLPARLGDATKIYLVKQQIPRSTYTAVTSSFAVQTVFDTSTGLMVFAYALTQGILPTPPQMPRIPALDYTFWSSNPHLAVLAITGLALLAVLVVPIVARRISGFWGRVRQGAIVLATPVRYLRTVWAWQAVGWGCRFLAFWFLLDAFHIGGSFGNVMLVMSVQAVANIVPLTPGGAGAQQALLVATLEGPSRLAVLSFSVGTQIVMAAWSAVLGLAALITVFGTSDWRGLIERARAEQKAARAEKAD